MVLSKEDIESLLKKVECKLEKAMKAKDITAVSELYHPDAVLVQRGGTSYYGREAIKNACEPFTQISDKLNLKPNYAAEAGNGEYLIRRGTYTVGDNPKVFEYEQIFKKVNGNYLIYHDEFSYE